MTATTLEDIDAMLTIASPYLHDGCRRVEAVSLLDDLLDARLDVMEPTQP